VWREPRVPGGEDSQSWQQTAFIRARCFKCPGPVPRTEGSRLAWLPLCRCAHVQRASCGLLATLPEPWPRGANRGSSCPLRARCRCRGRTVSPPAGLEAPTRSPGPHQWWPSETTSGPARCRPAGPALAHTRSIHYLRWLGGVPPEPLGDQSDGGGEPSGVEPGTGQGQWVGGQRAQGGADGKGRGGGGGGMRAMGSRQRGAGRAGTGPPGRAFLPFPERCLLSGPRGLLHCRHLQGGAQPQRPIPEPRPAPLGPALLLRLAPRTREYYSGHSDPPAP